MSTAVATTDQKFELVSAEQVEYLKDIDGTLRAYHAAMRESDYAYSYLLSEIAAVQAEDRLRKLLMHDGIVKIFRKLAGTKRGFSVAEKQGVGAISDAQLIDLMIDAAMKGLRFRGNEFTLIAKSVYANKEAYRRFLREMGVAYEAHPGVPDLTVRKGWAYIDASINYSWRGKVGRLDFVRSETRDERIVLKAYDTDSADLHRGKAESKLLRRLYEHLTGASLPCFADYEDGVIEGEAQRVEQMFDPDTGLPANTRE